MSELIFIDTSAWYAYVNSKDPNHQLISNLMHRLKGDLVTSNYVFDEILTLVRMRMGHSVAVEVGEALLNPKNVFMERVTAKDERHAWQLFSARKDQSYSYTDCTSFIIMKRMGIKQALTLDKHFCTEGFCIVR
ncbi:type II toxin-antitoxin system VapC family toxin [Dethiobacter alkaliphilus]|uniref:type II toxin-antitoxin system VapC family toxin n=1 Tax=Dethiobacter alkaliphilus TaxID=427926 RepID=UPI0022273614|nr:PIN domain-containing protein [Dethiobacter alkaliphilus]MCW3490719.1 PIN domain-containing protein [Dethiobacter alkaliphilus]